MTMDVIAEDERFAAMLLSRVGYYHLQEIRTLYTMVGSAQAVVAASDDIRQVLPDASPRLVQLLSHLSDHRQRVADELAYVEAEGVRVLTPCDSGYPRRLWECVDAPLVLYARGEACLNARRVVSVVGTRRCTRYGQDLIHSFVHRYPRAHRETANRMVAEGGALLTEFMTHTTADKINFVRRNRIVAGMSDAVVLVESADKGGGLITCGIARDYARDVFAFPGAVGAPYSEGCNHLIRDNGAGLITCADELVEAMGWQTDQKLTEAKRKGIERQLFPDLSPEEQRVVDELRKCNDLQINDLCVRLSVGVGPLTALLFSLEMKGVVRAYAGGSYHLVAD